MTATTRRPFSTLLCFTLAAATLLVSGTQAVRADDLLEEVRRQNAILASKLKREASRALVEAQVEGKRDPASAARMLKDFRLRIEDNKVLTTEDRAYLLGRFDSLIAVYDRGATRAAERTANREQAEALARERLRETNQAAARQADKQRAMARASQFFRDGKFDEAHKAAREAGIKYGRSPSVTGLERSSRLNDSLATLRSIRNERDRRYILAMREVVRSSMPVVGDIEFPADWKEKTKRRTKTLLTEEEKKLIKALNTPITTTIKDKPLQGVIDYLEKTTGLHFEMDKAALDQLMLNYESPVSGTANNISMRGFLKKLFGDLGLTYVIRSGKLIVTTPDRAAQMMVVKTYYIGDLTNLPNFAFGPVYNQLQMVQNVASLIAFIQSIDPASWQPTGPGTIVFNPLTMSISVKQTAEMQLMLSGGLGR